MELELPSIVKKAIPGVALLHEAPIWQRIAVGATLASCGAVVRLLFIGTLASHARFGTYYTAVSLASLLGGWVAGGTAAITGLMVSFSTGSKTSSANFIFQFSFFVICSALIIVTADALHRVWKRMIELESGRTRSEELAKERLRLAADAANIGTWDFDVETDTISIDDQVRRMYGFSRSADVTLPIICSLFRPEDRRAARKASKAALKPDGSGIYDVKYRIRRVDDGSERWLHAQAQAILRINQPPRLVGICRDITEEALIEAKNLERIDLAERLEQIAASVLGCIYTVHISPNGSLSITYASAKIKDVFGYALREVSTDASPIIQRIKFDDVDQIDGSWSARAPWSNEFRYDHPQKGIIWIEAHSIPTRQRGGGVNWHGYAYDITKRKVAEHALVESEERLRSVVDGANDAIVTMNRRGIIQSVNPAASRIFGYNAEELLGENLFILLLRVDQNVDFCVEEFIRSWPTTTSREGLEVQALGKDGIELPIRFTLSETSHENATIFVAFMHDLSNQRKVESHLEDLRAKRIMALRAMSASLAHEINQPLLAGASYLAAARQMLKTHSNNSLTDLDDTLFKAINQMLRAGEIVARLKGFVTHEEANKTFQDLHNVIEEAIELLREELERFGVRFSLSLNADRDSVLVDRVQITQVIVNLVRNAEQAMVDSRSKSLEIQTSTPTSESIQFDVVDSGQGLSDTVMSNMFQPFVTTKSSGTGVGLYISKLIIESHYGQLWATQNDRGRGGATFSFSLPLVEESAYE